MTSVSCPICGKQTPLTSFYPENYPVDIRIIEVRGLGRGRGFENVSDVSIFDFGSEYDDLLTRIAKRIFAITRLLIDYDVVTPEWVAQKLGLE